ncbi:MAG: galactokinase [Clostridia bacterium]|nr:galactokinase [Clostridia bacterium]
MKINELKKILSEKGLEKYSSLYDDVCAEALRISRAADDFEKNFGKGRDVSVYSAPGRSEIIGNHTDHNGGTAMAGAVTRDIIAVASKNDDGVIRFCSEGFNKDVVRLSDIKNPEAFRKYTSRALVAGIARKFMDEGYQVGGCDIYLTTEVPKGSGLSSSAAFEVMIGNVLSHLYNGGRVENEKIAVIAQYSENVYFGKPCGLMDQMASAVGGFVYMDFSDKNAARVQPIEFSLSDAGYSLCIVNTGGSHANLNDDYAAVPAEMRAVAAVLGKEILAGTTEEEIISNAAKIRKTAGDRALLRAIHFVRECARVEKAKEALLMGDVSKFLVQIKASGDSSYKYLQNSYAPKAPEEQGISLALALADGYLCSRGGAFRVHGGGFAGTIQAFVRNGDAQEFAGYMNSVFGEGATEILGVRPLGAVRLF